MRAGASIDVSQRVIDAHVDTLNFGQSFTAGADALLSAIRVSVFASSGGSDITVRVSEFDRETLSISPAVLGAGRAREPEFSAQPSWVEIALESAVPLAGGRTYAFTIEADDPGGETGWNNYGAAFTDVYGGGEFFFGLSGTAQTNTNIKELAFETVVVPEPVGATILCVGSALLAVRGRREARDGRRLA